MNGSENETANHLLSESDSGDRPSTVGTNPITRVFLFRPTLGEGGADRVTITLLRGLDRKIFQPTLVLVKREGVLVDEVPSDVDIIDLGVSRLRFSWLRLASVLRRECPDILLSTSSAGNVVASLAHLIVKNPNRRLILSERSTFSAVRKERRPRWLPVVATTRRLYMQANQIIAVSEGVAQDLEKCLALPDGLVIAIHNPIVDDELVELANQRIEHPWFLDEHPILLAVGRLVKQKDYPVLLQAFARIRSKRKVRLIILGEGDLRRELEALAKRMGVRDDIEFPGFVKNPFPYMRASTVYVLSSRLEGLPGALIQAMACGVPSVATNCPSGPSEIIQSGVNGFLVPVGDHEKLATAIEDLLDNPDLRRSFSERGRSVAETFKAATIIRRYENALLNSSRDACR